MKTSAFGSVFGIHLQVKSFNPLEFNIYSCRKIYILIYITPWQNIPTGNKLEKEKTTEELIKIGISGWPLRNLCFPYHYPGGNRNINTNIVRNMARRLRNEKPDRRVYSEQRRFNYHFDVEEIEIELRRLDRFKEDIWRRQIWSKRKDFYLKETGQRDLSLIRKRETNKELILHGQGANVHGLLLYRRQPMRIRVSQQLGPRWSFTALPMLALFLSPSYICELVKHIFPLIADSSLAPVSLRSCS